MQKKINTIKHLFKSSQESITAIGDETRQAIITTLLDGTKKGMRVGEITTKTHLSRPAVSHHLKILKDANIVSVNKSGTMNFYYLKPDIEEIKRIENICQLIIECYIKSTESEEYSK